MADGLGNRLASLRAHRGIGLKELSALTGVPHNDLLALETGGRRALSPEKLRRLAGFFSTTPEYLADGQEPSAEALRAGFLHHYDGLAVQEREQLKFAPIQARIEAVLGFLEGAYPTLLDRAQVAARLGYSPQALQEVLRDSAPLQSHLLKRLAGLTGLSLDFLVRGDFFGGAGDSGHLAGHARLSEYYEVVQEAIAQGISPAMLRKAVRILATRDQEET